MTPGSGDWVLCTEDPEIAELVAANDCGNQGLHSREFWPPGAIALAEDARDGEPT